MPSSFSSLSRRRRRRSTHVSQDRERETTFEALSLSSLKQKTFREREREREKALIRVCVYREETLHRALARRKRFEKLLFRTKPRRRDVTNERLLSERALSFAGEENVSLVCVNTHTVPRDGALFICTQCVDAFALASTFSLNSRTCSRRASRAATRSARVTSA